MTSRSYYLHQAQVCMSLARGTDNPSLKRRYEDLVIEFMNRGWREPDSEDDAESDLALHARAKPKPDAATPACTRDRPQTAAGGPQRG